MAFVSNTQLATIQDSFVQKDNQIASLKKRLAEGIQLDKTVALLETVGSAGVMGALRGKMEDANGAWNIPGTTVDIEGVAGITLLALGYFAGTKQGKKTPLKNAGNHLMNAANGILAHYVGQIARNGVKTGHFTLIAGNHALSGY